MSKIVAQSEKFRLMESILFQNVFLLEQNLILLAQRSSPTIPQFLETFYVESEIVP